MKISCRYVKVGERLQGQCSQCDEAWHLWKKSLRLIKKSRKNENKVLFRRAHWLRVLCAKILYEDRKHHKKTPRAVPLIIVCGEVRGLKVSSCWNCNHSLLLTMSKWSEELFCGTCDSTILDQWYFGEISNEQMTEKMTDRLNPPYRAKGKWEDYRWSKKKKDLVYIGVRPNGD